MKQDIRSIRAFLLDYAQKAGAKGYCLGISGGLDSSVLFKILEGIPELQTYALMLPIHSASADASDAQELVRGSRAEVRVIDLSASYDALRRALPKASIPMSDHNIKPRLRMIALYHEAQSRGYLVAGAANRSEWMMGYFTKHGDSGVDVLPLVAYEKSEIYAMAIALGVPRTILEKAPSAGLYAGQTDEREMGVRYEDIRRVLAGEKVDEAIRLKVQSMMDFTERKRKLPVSYQRKDDHHVRSLEVE